MIFAFIQRCGLVDKDYFKNLLNKSNLPKYYQSFIKQILNDEIITDVYHRTEINIPQKTYYKEDIFAAAK